MWRAWVRRRQGGRCRGHGVAQSQLPAAGSWPEGNWLVTGRPGRHSKERWESESPVVGPVLSQALAPTTPSSVMKTLCWGKGHLGCELLQPHAPLSLVPDQGEEGKEVPSATPPKRRAKPQNWSQRHSNQSL